MSKTFGKDLTVGSIPKHLLVFSVPMLIGNMLQTGYNIINTIWIGNILGENAVGATAVGSPIIFILISLAIGATTATTILVSQYYGAKNYEMMKKVANNSFSVTLIIGILMTFLGIWSRDIVLRLMGTPTEIFNMASEYLKICLVPFLMLYFSALILSILRGIGDTVTPLIFTAIGVGINAILDPLMIMGIGPFPELGLNGAAYASMIGQGIAFLSSIVYLNRKSHLISFDFRKFILDKEITLSICKLGFPFAIQSALVSMGTLFITTFVNSFGTAATNAFGAGGRVDQLAFMPAQSIGSAVSTLTAQNLGANKPERVKDVFKWGVIITSCITIMTSIVAILFPGFILSIFGFGKGSQGFEIGISYLRIAGSGYIFFAILLVANGVITGAGQTLIPMLVSLLSLWIVRIPLAAILSKTSLGLAGIWISMVLGFAAAMIACLIYYLSGRWRNSGLIITPKSLSVENSDIV